MSPKAPETISPKGASPKAPKQESWNLSFSLCRALQNPSLVQARSEESPNEGWRGHQGLRVPLAGAGGREDSSVEVEGFRGLGFSRLRA